MNPELSDPRARPPRTRRRRHRRGARPTRRCEPGARGTAHEPGVEDVSKRSFDALGQTPTGLSDLDVDPAGALGAVGDGLRTVGKQKECDRVFVPMGLVVAPVELSVDAALVEHERLRSVFLVERCVPSGGGAHGGIEPIGIVPVCWSHGSVHQDPVSTRNPVDQRLTIPDERLHVCDAEHAFFELHDASEQYQAFRRQVHCVGHEHDSSPSSPRLFWCHFTPE